MTASNKYLEVNLDHQLEDLQLHLGLTAEIITVVSVTENLVILSKVS